MKGKKIYRIEFERGSCCELYDLTQEVFWVRFLLSCKVGANMLAFEEESMRLCMWKHLANNKYSVHVVVNQSCPRRSYPVTTFYPKLQFCHLSFSPLLLFYQAVGSFSKIQHLWACSCWDLFPRRSKSLCRDIFKAFCYFSWILPS